MQGLLAVSISMSAWVGPPRCLQDSSAWWKVALIESLCYLCALHNRGPGNAAIHNVVISRTPTNLFKYHSNIPLKRKRHETKLELQNAKHARTTLDSYLGTVDAQEVDISKSDNIVNGYFGLSCKLTAPARPLERGGRRLQAETSCSSPDGPGADRTSFVKDGKFSWLVDIMMQLSSVSLWFFNMNLVSWRGFEERGSVPRIRLWK